MASIEYPVSATDADDLSWQDKGYCLNKADVFFPDKKDPLKLKKIKLAKDICSACVVQEPCLEFALNNNESKGVWGGKDEFEREEILRDRQQTGYTPGVYIAEVA